MCANGVERIEVRFPVERRELKLLGLLYASYLVLCGKLEPNLGDHRIQNKWSEIELRKELGCNIGRGEKIVVPIKRA